MIKIMTDDVSTLKDACEYLAYKVAQYENPGQYDWADEQIGMILACEGLEVEYD